jgi:hypothetical protein
MIKEHNARTQRAPYHRKRSEAALSWQAPLLGLLIGTTAAALQNAMRGVLPPALTLPMALVPMLRGYKGLGGF